MRPGLLRKLRRGRTQIRDLTDKGSVERSLASTRLLYKTVVEGSAELMTLTNADGVFLYVSPQHKAVLRVDPAELKGQRSGMLVHPDDRGRLELAREVAITNGNSLAENVRIANADGDWLHFEITFARIPGAHADEEALLVSSGRDVTSRVRTEEQRASLEQQLHAAHRLEAIGRVTAGVAHDFNNLLAAIQGFATLGQAAAANDKTTRYFNEIESAGQKATELTRQLLTFARKQTLSPAVLDLNELVRSVSSLLRRLAPDRIELQFDLSPQPVCVFADYSHLEHVVLNLVVNSRDAIEDTGTITIRTATEPPVGVVHDIHVASGWLQVIDTGAGIPDDVKPQIFEPFFTTKAPDTGTGLGLATIYGIVHQSGGSIFVESTVGAGTTMTIALPAQHGAAEERET